MTFNDPSLKLTGKVSRARAAILLRSARFSLREHGLERTIDFIQDIECSLSYAQAISGKPYPRAVDYLVNHDWTLRLYAKREARKEPAALKMFRGQLRTDDDINELERLRKIAFPHLYK